MTFVKPDKPDFSGRPRVNEKIRAPKVRVIGPDGKQLGIMSPAEALEKAYEFRLDLVEIAPNENPPVCKITDYGKYLYELKKRDKETRKKQRSMQLKEIRLTARTSEHDYQIKLKKVRELLDEGYRVKVNVFFKGREITHIDKGDELLKKVMEDTKDIGKVEIEPKLEGRTLSLQLIPAHKKG